MLLRFRNYWGIQHRRWGRLGGCRGDCRRHQAGQPAHLPPGLRRVGDRVGVGHHREVRLPAAAQVDRADHVARLTKEMAANAGVSARTVSDAGAAMAASN
jgi:hypothetical protein